MFLPKNRCLWSCANSLHTKIWYTQRTSWNAWWCLRLISVITCFCTHECKPCLTHINLHTDTDTVVPILPKPLRMSSDVLHHYIWWANSTSYVAIQSNSSYDTSGSLHLTYQDNPTHFIMCLKLWNDIWHKTYIPFIFQRRGADCFI